MYREYKEGRCSCTDSKAHTEIEDFDSCIRGRIDAIVCKICKVVISISVIR